MNNETIMLVSTVVQLIISIILAYTAWVFNRVSIRKATRQEHASMLREIDQIVLNNPELYEIYDSHELAKHKSTSPKDIVKREAFILLMLNTYEVIFDYYTNIIVKNKDDKSYWSAWQISISEFFSESSEARELFMKYKGQYSSNFSNFAAKTIQNIKSPTTSVYN